MILIALGAYGCVPIIISAAGVGAGAVFSHHINGQSSRKFTEVVTPSTTLMRTVARNQSGLTVDSATATEIQQSAAVERH